MLFFHCRFTVNIQTFRLQIKPTSVKTKILLKVFGIKNINTNLTKKQKEEQMGFSDSIIERNRDNLKMDSVQQRSHAKKELANKIPWTQLV